MKNKKILIVLLCAMFVALPSVVKADTDAGSDGNFGSSCKGSSIICYTTRMPGKQTINGIRVTIVNSSGARVTKSIDIVNDSSVAGTSTNLGQGTLQYNRKCSGNGCSLQTLGHNTRNEMLSMGSSASGTYTDPSSITVYYWNKLPDFVDTGGKNSIKQLFTTLSTTYKSDYDTIMSLLGYNPKNANAVNEYILVETLVYTNIHTSSSNLATYYGTATEVYYMMAAQNRRYIINSEWATALPLSIHTENRVQDGATYTNTAGLQSIEGISKSNWSSDMTSTYGLAAGHIWVPDTIQECIKGVTCPEEAKPVSGCNADPTTSFTNNCDSSTSGSANDTTNWTCIFSNINSSANTFEGQFYHVNGTSVSNSYCNVACREDISYNFSSSDLTVDAGYRFSVGTVGGVSSDISYLQPITFDGTSTCRTGYRTGTTNATINVAQFVSDYKAANEAVQVAWDNLQINIAKQKSINSAHSNAGGTSSYEGTHACTKQTHYPNWIEGHTNTSYPYNWIPGYDAGYDGDPCLSYEHDNKEHYTVTTHYGSTFYYKGVGYREQYDTSTCGQHLNPGDHSFNTSPAAYLAAVANRTAILNKLLSCNNFQRGYSEFSPEVAFAYADSKYGSSYQLDSVATQKTSETTYFKGSSAVGSKSWSIQENDQLAAPASALVNASSDVFGSSGLVNGSKEQIATWHCGLGELVVCNPEEIVYPTNDYAVQVTKREYKYKLPDNIYRYVSKDGISYHTDYGADMEGVPYIDIGYSSLPVAFTDEEGRYPYYLEFYYYNGADNLFGADQKFLKYNPRRLFDTGGTTSFGGLMTITSKPKYACSYYVNKELIGCQGTSCSKRCEEDNSCGDVCENNSCKCEGDSCDGGGGGDTIPDIGLTPVYRTISLSDPFPGPDGNGRSSGSNWTSNSVSSYITNNRGVSTDEVYNLKPMYQFVLSPSNIRAIRKYNNSQSEDYNDFTLDCDNGKYCTSSFLQDGISNGYFSFTNSNSGGGTCFGVGESNWDSCRY